LALGNDAGMAQEPVEYIQPLEAPADEGPPSIEFLEFLGEFETDDGEWTGPDDIEEMGLKYKDQKENEEK